MSSTVVVIDDAYARRLMSTYRTIHTTKMSKHANFPGWTHEAVTIYRFIQQIIRSTADHVFPAAHLQPHLDSILAKKGARTYLNYLNTFLKCIPESDRAHIDWGPHNTWSNAHSHIQTMWQAETAKADAFLADGRLNSHEQQHYVGWTTIVAAVDAFRKTHANVLSPPTPTSVSDDAESLQIRWHYLIMLLYTTTTDAAGNLMGPRRGELISLLLRVPQDNEEVNGIDFDRGVAILQQYKTYKSYGKYEMPLSAEILRMIDLIRTSDAFHHKMGRNSEHLFKYHAQWYAPVIADAFDACGLGSLGVRVLRKSFVDHVFQQGQLKTWSDYTRLATSMANSAYTLHRCYMLKPEKYQNTHKEVIDVEDDADVREYIDDEDSAEAENSVFEIVDGADDCPEVVGVEDVVAPPVQAGVRVPGPVVFETDEENNSDDVHRPSKKKRRQYISIRVNSDAYKTLQTIAPRYRNDKGRPWTLIFKSKEIMPHNQKTVAENLARIGCDDDDDEERDVPHETKVRIVHNAIARMPEWSSEEAVEQYRRARVDAVRRNRERRRN